MTSTSLWDRFQRRVMYGFHGNSTARIDTMRRQRFRREGLPGDWLGAGMYFWLDAPERAWDWADGIVAQALSKASDEEAQTPSVIIAELQVTDLWIDLIDQSPWFDRFRNAAQHLAEMGVLPLQNRPLAASVAHPRDFALMEKAMNDATLNGIAVEAIRSAFVEGEAVAAGSAIYSQARVQIAVRNPDVILATENMSR